MADLKSLRKRIGSVKNTQKITRAMKMVAAARLNRSQQRISAMRPYAVRTAEVLAEVVAASTAAVEGGTDAGGGELEHPLLARRPEKRALFLVVSGDRGLCGAFNSSINKAAERGWRERVAEGKEVSFAIVGRKGRDYFKRRKAPITKIFEGVWEDMGPEKARAIAHDVLAPFLAGEVDAIYLVYNEFKSAMTQKVIFEPLFPLQKAVGSAPTRPDALLSTFTYEPSKEALLERLVPMYVEISILRALYESRASFFGAQMTAMDSATKNASDLIDRLTLVYNRARQAAITTEIMEIIGGAEALKG
ncbi:MAG TPA: ATP synthase F1 subunit gamma [Polyangiaceae bacterium]|nr:ATP synthase F1 subunit gamma [Polyangiaceae bacterium]